MVFTQVIWGEVPIAGFTVNSFLDVSENGVYQQVVSINQNLELSNPKLELKLDVNNKN